MEPNLPDFVLSASSSLRGSPTPLNQVLNTTWLNLERMLTNSLFHSIFVNPLGSVTPVCGTPSYKFSVAIEENLCLRWYLVAATLPLFYINSDGDYHRDPVTFLSKNVQEKAIVAIRKRYALLPYFNTVLKSGIPNEGKLNTLQEK